MGRVSQCPQKRIVLSPNINPRALRLLIFIISIIIIHQAQISL